MQASNSVKGGYFCIGFIYFIYDNKVFIILLPLNNFPENDKIITNIYKKYQGNVSRFFSSSFDI